jgi:hypothetical protein
MADLMRFMQTDRENDINFRDSGNKFLFQSEMTRDNGSHWCGYNFIRSPGLTSDAPSVVVASSGSNTETITNSVTSRMNLTPRGDDNDFVTHAALHEISFKVRERLTGETFGDLPATGALANVDAWAKHLLQR